MASPGGLEMVEVWAERAGSHFSRSLRGTGRSSSARLSWGLDPGNVFGGPSASRREVGIDDEEALKWAALEKLPTYDRLRTTVIVNEDGNKILHDTVDLRTLGLAERQQLIQKTLKVAEEDNEKFLLKLRERIGQGGNRNSHNRGRYENLTVNADCRVGGRALPTLWNSARNILEVLLAPILRRRKTELNILHNVSGSIKPGRMTLLLGPPSSGKTTFLLALAGKLDPDLRVSGKVTYNGHTLDEFVPQKTAVYISQHDLHTPEMTVRETLAFSARCQGVGTRYQLLSELVKREKAAGIFPEADVDFFMKATAMEGVESGLQTDYTLRVLGLDVCADIMVGDAMRRGVSGGQRKRATTGEMIVGPTKTLFMDEISTGLDSSTTFQIVKCLRHFSHVMESTILMSLLQPAPETFELFDDVILLSEGQVVYHGPCENVLEFFESCGFQCPDRKGVADFLQEVTSQKDQEQYWFNRHRPYQYVSVRQFTNAYKNFRVGAKLHQELMTPFDKSNSHQAALSHDKYSISKWELFKANFAKELILVQRNSFVYIFKTVQIIVIGFITMTVYLRTNMPRETVEDGQIYASSLFFGVIVVMFNGFAETSMTISRLPVFFKQRDLLFFPAWAYTLPTVVLRLPMSLLDAGLWIIMTYFVIGYTPEASRYFRQFLLLFVTHQMSSGLFRFMAGVCRTTIVANTGGTFALLLVFMLGGFIIPRPDIKPWWIWGYWVSPLTYSNTGITSNELLAPRWDKKLPNTTHSLGQQVLVNAGTFTEPYWYWISIAALIGYAIFFNVLWTLALAYLRPIGKPQAVVTEEALARKHASLSGDDVPLTPARTSHTRKLPRSLSSQDGNSSPNSVTMDPMYMVQDQPDVEDGAPDPVRLSISAQIARMSVSNEDRDHKDFLDPGFESVSTREKVTTRGMILPFEPLSISFDDIKYSVDMPAEMKQQGIAEDRLQLLRGVTGSFRPGVLTALVGISGAGKTTLMDVLAGRKTGGYIEGDIRIAGYPKNQETFARIAGYCEQNDIHSPQVTVLESVIYSAWLRLSADIHDADKMIFVNEVMELVELVPLQDALVGLPGVTGLSTEQRKRLTIAVELVANPSIIFMDEPTSGLDARAAAIVMRTVRNTVDTGRTVVCTIHQPSIDIFEAFDEAVPGIPKIKDGYNPATWMLEVSSVAVEQQLGVDFADVYKNSSLYEQNRALVKELSSPLPGSKDLYFPTQYAQPAFQQLKSCTWKMSKTYFRNPDYNGVRYIFTIGAAILFGTIFWDFGQKGTDQAKLFSVMGAMYGATLFLGTNNCGAVQPLISIERTVFYRERAARMYSALPYAMSQVLIEMPYVFVQTILYAFITYSMINFQWTGAKFMWYVFIMFTTFLYFTYYGMMAVALTPNHQIAAITASGFYSIWNLFSGFIIPRPRIPIWWRWYTWACPVHWTLYGLIASQFGDVDKTFVKNNFASNILVKDYIADHFGFHHSFLGVVAAMLIIFPSLFAFVFAYSIKNFNFVRR